MRLIEFFGDIEFLAGLDVDETAIVVAFERLEAGGLGARDGIRGAAPDQRLRGGHDAMDRALAGRAGSEGRIVDPLEHLEPSAAIDAGSVVGLVDVDRHAR